MTKDISPPAAGVPNYVPSFEALADRGWQAANWLTVVTVTSVAIALVQSPLNSLMINHIVHGKVIPSSLHTSGNVLAAVQALYVGLGANFAGSSARTVYVVGAKKNKEVDNNELVATTAADKAHGVTTTIDSSKSKNTFLRELGYVTVISLGDVLVTQLHENKAQLIKAQVIDSRFNLRTPYNLYKLGTIGFYARFSGGLVNYTSLCIVEAFYASHMPGGHYKANHFLAGAASGMTAAIFSYPFSYYRDYFISKMSVMDGKLQAPSALKLANETRLHIKTVGLGSAVQQVAREFAVQAPLRMGRTGATFALVSGVSALLGEEPLTAIIAKCSDSCKSGVLGRFFSQPKIKDGEPVKSGPQVKP